MKYTLTSPCDSCPFRSDIRPFLRGARAEEITESLRRGGEFPCHKSTGTQSEEDESSRDKAEWVACAGALLVTERDYGPNQMHRIVMRLGLYDPEELDRDAPCFEDLDEFIRANFREEAKREARLSKPKAKMRKKRSSPKKRAR